MNPGVSAACTGDLPQVRMSVIAAAMTDVPLPTQGMTSTNGIEIGGLKKCRPSTRAGEVHDDAIRVIDKDDVLLASMHSGDTTCSRRPNTVRLTARSSTTASITRPHGANTPRSASGSRALDR